MPRNKYTKELLEPIVKESKSWAEVCRKCNITPATGAQTHLTHKAKDLEIDSSHFRGQGWSKGLVLPPKQPTEKYLSNELGIKSHSLKLRLIKEGLKEKRCELCNLAEWKGEPIDRKSTRLNSSH